jgi:seryl-tRNA synthetase
VIDIRLIREDPDLVRKTLRDRQMEPDIVDRIQYLDTLRRDLIQQAEDLKAQRNRVSKEIGLMKDSPEKEARKDAMRLVSNQIGDLDGQLREVDTELDKSMAEIPNIPDNRTPYGKGEEDNVVIKQVGEETKPIPNPLPHWELGPELGIINFEQGVKIAGSRFYVLSGAGARLQRALISWMLDLHIRQGYTEKYTPFMVKGETMFASGQLPKFTDNLYKDHE